MSVKHIYHVDKPNINYKTHSQALSKHRLCMSVHVIFKFILKIIVVKLGRESILMKILLQNSSHTKMKPSGISGSCDR